MENPHSLEASGFYILSIITHPLRLFIILTDVSHMLLVVELVLHRQWGVFRCSFFIRAIPIWSGAGGIGNYSFLHF